MAVFFRASISDAVAFEMIEERFASGTDFDGYLNVYGADNELTLSWTRGMRADEFKEEVSIAMRSTWETARFWLAYERSDSRNDLEINEIRSAAIRLTRSYEGAAVVTFSLLGRLESAHDLELVFICFRDDTERRNFRVRYEGKFVQA